MAIDVTLQNITSGYNTSKINDNFTTLASALSDALSRSGASPNQMVFDIDLNGNDLLNAGNGQFTTLFINGTDVHDIAGNPGPTGAAGTNGTNGSIWFTGNIDPVSGLGSVNDFYLQTGTGSTGVKGDVWKKVVSTWTKQGVNLVGPQGASGSGSGDMIHATYDPANVNQQVVGTTATQTMTNKTLTSPVINSPTGIVKGDVGLGSVDNTADTAKPVSTAQATAIALKATIASPTFTGVPAAPTATSGTNTTQLATTAFVTDALTKLTGYNVSASSYTLVLTDAGKFVEMNVSSTSNLTVPPNSSVAFPLNTMIMISQLTANQVTVVAGAGVIIRSNPGLKLNGQFAVAALYKKGTDEWYLAGNLTA